MYADLGPVSATNDFAGHMAVIDDELLIGTEEGSKHRRPGSNTDIVVAE